MEFESVSMGNLEGLRRYAQEIKYLILLYNTLIQRYL